MAPTSTEAVWEIVEVLRRRAGWSLTRATLARAGSLAGAAARATVTLRGAGSAALIRVALSPADPAKLQLLGGEYREMNGARIRNLPLHELVGELRCIDELLGEPRADVSEAPTTALAMLRVVDGAGAWSLQRIAFGVHFRLGNRMVAFASVIAAPKPDRDFVGCMFTTNRLPRTPACDAFLRDARRTLTDAGYETTTESDEIAVHRYRLEQASPALVLQQAVLLEGLLRDAYNAAM